jgi:hypothetical protein
MTSRFKVLDLTGWRLDAAVHLAQERLPEEEELLALGVSSLESIYSAEADESLDRTHPLLALRLDRPSQDWRIAGALIESERIALDPYGLHSGLPPGAWVARIAPLDSRRNALATGATPLEAAMRAFVYMELGKTIDLPL